MARKRSRRNRGTGNIWERGPQNFAIRWREGGRRRYDAGPGGHGYPTRALAEQVLAKIRGELARLRAGLPLDPQGFAPLSLCVDKDEDEWRGEGEDWIARRKLTHRAWRDDQSRWTRHLRPFFGRLYPAEVDAATIRRFVEAKLAEGLDPATVGHCVRLLSTMFTDFVERARETGVSANPVRSLPRSTRRLYKPTHRPEDTPYLKSPDDVARVYQALREEDEATAVAFAVGYFAALRTGEVLGLKWRLVDLERREITVCEQVQDSRLGPLKDGETRIVPVQAGLAPILAAYKLRTGGQGDALLFPPDSPGRRAGKSGRPSEFMRPRTLHLRLRAALAACKVPPDPKTGEPLTWYECTRHTGASHWVMSGGSIEKLAKVMGHSSAEVTRRYAHVDPRRFSERDKSLLDADLSRPRGEAVPADFGHGTGTGGHDDAAPGAVSP